MNEEYTDVQISVSDELSEQAKACEICDSVEEDETASPEASIDSLMEEISSLKSEISRLESERDMQMRLLEEISDFRSLFPSVEIEQIPESVGESVKKGTPLSASYALYEKRLLAEEARIASINAQNASRSAGVAGRDVASEYFTPDEVKRMSRSEVHANYKKIKESMKKWIEN